MLTVVRDSEDVPAGLVDGASLIDEIVREGARRMLAAVRHRTKVTKGPGSKAAGLAMAFKLIEAAQAAGDPSTHPISSRSSASAPRSRRASSSSGPTAPVALNQRRHNQDRSSTS